MKSEIIRFVTMVVMTSILLASLICGWVPSEPGTVEMLVIMVSHMVILTIVILTYVVSVINRSNLEVSEVNLRIVGGLNSYVKTGYGIE